MLVLRLLPAAPLLLAAACSSPAPSEGQGANATLEAGVPAEPTASAPDAAPATPATAATPATTATPASSATPEASASPASGETVGGDGSPITLSALRPSDGEALKGELACTFAASAKAAPILLARANVGRGERGVAAIRNGSVAETLVARSEGGFGAMAKGATFGGKGMTVRIAPQASRKTGDESTAHQATLLVQRGDGAERTYAGLWTCGP